MTMTILPLATTDQLLAFGSAQELFQNETRWSPSQLNWLLVSATTHLQTRCQRRITPFTGLTESHQAYGISPDEYGDQGDLPMDLTGALGWSQASALGVSSMVREFWLDQTAPMYQEWWSYNLESVTLSRTFGDTQDFGVADFTTWTGPNPDTGYVRMPIGTYCPVGTIISVTYGGGYSTTPPDLVLACIFQAMAFALIGNEPYADRGATANQLDAAIVQILGEYAKY